ncbi:MAG: TolC family protein, partial [Planctomycetes bacterium]|nr:TolC family protein [Planctomycetota bacterium]
RGRGGAPAPPPRAVTESPPPKTILQPGEYPIDLGSALQLAGVESPELLLARARVSEVVAQRQFAAAQLLPNLNLGTNYDQHRGPLQQSNGNILPVNRDALYFGLGANAVAAGSVNIPGLNYNLNVGEGWFGFLVARQRVTTARATSEAVRNDVLLRVCLAYLDLLRGDARRAIVAKNRTEAAELARLTAVYAQRGQGRQADADRAAVELQKRDAELAQAEADTLTASARLAELLNLDPSTRFRPIDGWAVPAPLVPDPVPLPDLLAIALMQRPELAARRSEVRSTLYELSLAKVLPFSPNVILGFSAGGFGGGSNLISSPQGFVAGNGQLQTGPRFGNFDGRSDFDVVVFWTFRNLGVGNVALVRAADSRVKQMRLRELEAVNVVRREVAQAKARVDARLLQIEAGEKAVRISSDAYTEDLTRIRGGQGLPLEVVDSMRLLARSRLEYLEAIIEYNRAQFQLWVALGRPPANALARPVPPELVPPPVIEIQPGPRVLPIPKILNSPLPVKP